MKGLAAYIETGRAVNARREYNGYSADQRKLVNRPQRVFKKMHPDTEPTVCSISGYSSPDDPKGAGYCYSHTETYDVEDTLDWYPCSKLAHRLLHNRFVEPRRWFDFVASNYQHGAWFTFLVMSPAKMQYLPSRKPYWSVYPHSLPSYGQYWEEYATACGISRELFQQDDLAEIIKFFWSFPRPADGSLPPPRQPTHAHILDGRAERDLDPRPDKPGYNPGYRVNRCMDANYSQARLPGI